jgi:hypothetical protein
MNPISGASRSHAHHGAHHVKSQGAAGAKGGTSPLGAPTAAPGDGDFSLKPGTSRLGGPAPAANDAAPGTRQAGPLGGPGAPVTDGPVPKNPLATPLGGPAPVNGEPDAAAGTGGGVDYRA